MLNMELKFLWAPCAQLHSLDVTFGLIYAGACLSVSQDAGTGLESIHLTFKIFDAENEAREHSVHQKPSVLTA